MTEKDNVATYARIRPYNPAINEDKTLTARATSGNKILNQSKDREDTYNFTKVFDMKHTNNTVFEMAMKPLLDYKILQGINSIFIVYGQSGSGKSFTLIGEEEHLGLLPLSLQYLLKQDIVQRIDIASIEAYGIKAAKIGFYDLVSQLSAKQKAPRKFDAYISKDNPRLNSSNAQFIQITNKNCLKIITDLQEASHMAPTLKNPHSSRGHTVYFARIKMKELEDVYFICVDLAGSEGQTALGTKDEFVNGLKLAMTKGKLKLTKQQMKGFEQMYNVRRLEAGCINNGLTQLQTIFGELIKQKISKSQGLGLRKVLSSFISLKSAYAILFTMSASANNNKVTKATLNFAKQTQLVKVDTQKAKKKIDKDAVIKELNRLIQQLRKDMDEKDVTIETLKQEISESNTETESKHDIDSVFLKVAALNRQLTAAEQEEAKWKVTSDTITVSHLSEKEMQDVFDKFDQDGSGSIDVNELHHALNEMGQEVSVEDVNRLINEIDENGDGEVNFEEFKVMVEQNWFVNAFQNRLVNSMKKMLTTMTTMDLLIMSDVDEKDSKSGDTNEIEVQDTEDMHIGGLEGDKDEKQAMEQMHKAEVERLQSVIDNLKREEIKLNNELAKTRNKDIEGENISTPRDNSMVMMKLVAGRSGGWCSSWWG